MNKINNINNIKWNMTPDEIINKTNKLIYKSNKIANKITQIKINNEGINIILSMLSNDLNEFNMFHSICGFLQFISPNDKIRKSSYTADLLLSEYVNKFNQRKDIYSKLVAIKQFNDNNRFLDDTDIIFIDKLILNFERNGIDLSDDKKQLLLTINQEISKLENAILECVAKYENTYITLNINELHGIPINIINTFEQIQDNSDIFKIQFNRINYSILMKYIDSSNLRKIIETNYSTKYNDILNYLFKLVVLKDKRAKLLSYKCHSDYKAHIQMTKNSDNIKNFLSELISKLDFRYCKEMDTMIKLAHGNINSWDIQYYITKWKHEYGVDENMLREYFELNNTIKEILSIYENIFNIKFVKSDKKSQQYDLWHDQVDTYYIKSNNQIIGCLFMDLYMRNGKYKQTRCFCLQPATLTQIPMICLASSFVRSATGEICTLINFHDVISLFHEIAHVLHHTFGKTKYSIFSGINVEIDFVETPAQLLDLLCWEKHIIKQLSKHYITCEPLQDKIIEKIIKLKNLDLGIYYKKNILVALFDQVMYSSDKFIDTCENILKNNDTEQQSFLISNLYDQLHEEIMTSSDKNPKYKIQLNKNIGLPIEWLNSVSISDSQYYSSIWSRVLSSDMYNEEIKGKVLNANIGLKLRDRILNYGGTKPAYEMICDYMQRKPAIDGFISMYDLDTDMEYSFFLNTDQIKNENTINEQKQIKQTKQTKQNIYVHKKQYNYDDEYLDSVSNRFSEINESSVCMNDFDHHRNDLNYLKNKCRNYRI